MKKPKSIKFYDDIPSLARITKDAFSTPSIEEVFGITASDIGTSAGIPTSYSPDPMSEELFPEELAEAVSKKVLEGLYPKCAADWVKRAIESGMSLSELGKAVIAEARGNENGSTREEKPVPKVPRRGAGPGR